ncbi:TraK family protein [Thiocystis violacea]|uniref:TraK family protein n=1 Tax=Thiocystis violacea TaxID=13725 RepID=UPI00190350FF|nr:TraK family protein [Thiocystis violacea]MBK1718079.1 hypothetical protein [Thiocystis violacea]
MAKQVSPEAYRRRLAARVEDRAQQHSETARHLSVFLALKPAIAGALASGFRQRTIWADLTESRQIDCTYQTFNRHVRQHIKTAQQVAKSTPTSKEEHNKKEWQGKAVERRDPLSGFQVQPIARREDLV